MIYLYDHLDIKQREDNTVSVYLHGSKYAINGIMYISFVFPLGLLLTDLHIQFFQSLKKIIMYISFL